LPRGRAERRHVGRVAVGARNTRWCSNGFETARDNGERVRVAFTPGCCGREATTFVGITRGISSEYLRDLMAEAVEHRFGLINHLTIPIAQMIGAS
jgi:putative transposase